MSKIYYWYPVLIQDGANKLSIYDLVHEETKIQERIDHFKEEGFFEDTNLIDLESSPELKDNDCYIVSGGTTKEDYLMFNDLFVLLQHSAMEEAKEANTDKKLGAE